MSTSLDLANTPAAVPPPGVESNLIDPEILWPYTIATCTCILVLTVPAVIIRLFTRLRIQKEFDWDDWVLIVAQMFVITWMGLFLGQPTRGAHIWDTSLVDLENFLYWSNIVIVFYCPTILICKWTVMLQIQRIFFVQRGDLPWWLSQGIVWGSTLFYTVVTLCDILECVPRVKIWQPQTPGTCLSIDSILLATCFFNIVMNAMIVAVPLLVVRKLHMTLKRKVTASVVFGLAALALIAAILRAVYTFRFNESNDITHNIFAVGYWAGAEMAFLIFATAFPTFPRFIEWCRGRDRDETLRKASIVREMPRSRPRDTLTSNAEWEMIDEQWSSKRDIRDGRQGSAPSGSDRDMTRSVPLSGIVRTVDFTVTHD